MELVYADEKLKEQGIVKVYDQYDAQISLESDDTSNSWQLDINEYEWLDKGLTLGGHLYYEGTEFGGKIEGIKHSSNSRTISLTGVTWRGMLARKVIEPPSGQAYFKIQNIEANSAIKTLIGSSFGDLIKVSDEDSKIIVSGQFRYTNLLEGITKLLKSSNARLNVVFNNPVITISAVSIKDVSGQVELSQDYGISTLSSEFSRTYSYNHVVAMGKGELLDREIIKVWRLPDGSTTTNPNHPERPRGLDEKVITYDYSSAESNEELLNGAIKRLDELSDKKEVSLDINTDLDIALGDVAGGRDRVTDLEIKEQISEKIININSSGLEYRYKTGK